MYSPKIRDDLIRKLYHLAKARGIPMTHLVNELLTKGLKETPREPETIQDPPPAIRRHPQNAGDER